MKKAGHRLALVAAPSALSLQLLSSLSERYSVSSWGNPERAVVQFREERPALVVVVCSRRNQAQMRTLVQRLKTEQRAPLVGLVVERGVPGDAAAFLHASGCDGLLGLPLEGSALHTWVDQLFAGQRPVSGPRQRGGRLRRVAQRFSGSRASSKGE